MPQTDRPPPHPARAGRRHPRGRRGARQRGRGQRAPGDRRAAPGGVRGRGPRRHRADGSGGCLAGTGGAGLRGPRRRCARIPGSWAWTCWFAAVLALAAIGTLAGGRITRGAVPRVLELSVGLVAATVGGALAIVEAMGARRSRGDSAAGRGPARPAGPGAPPAIRPGRLEHLRPLRPGAPRPARGRADRRGLRAPVRVGGRGLRPDRRRPPGVAAGPGPGGRHRARGHRGGRRLVPGPGCSRFAGGNLPALRRLRMRHPRPPAPPCPLRARRPPPGAATGRRAGADSAAAGRRRGGDASSSWWTSCSRPSSRCRLAYLFGGLDTLRRHRADLRGVRAAGILRAARGRGAGGRARRDAGPGRGAPVAGAARGVAGAARPDGRRAGVGVRAPPALPGGLRLDGAALRHRGVDRVAGGGARDRWPACCWPAGRAWVLHALGILLLVALGVMNVVGPQAFVAERNLERAIDPSLVPAGGRTGLDAAVPVVAGRRGGAGRRGRDRPAPGSCRPAAAGAVPAGTRGRLARGPGAPGLAGLERVPGARPARRSPTWERPTDRCLAR